MRYTIFFALVTCAAGQTPVAPSGPLAGGTPQHRVFQAPEWLKRQFHINPAAPGATLGAPTFGAPGLTQFAPNFGGAPGTVKECAIPLTPVHPAPGLVFPTPVQKPKVGPPLQNEFVQGLRVCGHPG